MSADRWAGIGTHDAKHARPKVTTAQREDIIRRRSEGETAWDLAIEYGISASLIYGWAKR